MSFSVLEIINNADIIDVKIVVATTKEAIFVLPLGTSITEYSEFYKTINEKSCSFKNKTGQKQGIE